jgi:hypothetical protein
VDRAAVERAAHLERIVALEADVVRLEAENAVLRPQALEVPALRQKVVELTNLFVNQKRQLLLRRPRSR